MKRPEVSYRALMGIPPAAVMQQQGHAPLAAARPHPRAPGRDAAGRITKAPAAAEICPSCRGTGRKGA